MDQTRLGEDLAQRLGPFVRWYLLFPHVRHIVHGLVPVGDGVHFYQYTKADQQVWWVRGG